ncbi:MAG: class I SAM-dependent RNA methyltransferase [Rhodobacteraceae bacterium]|jgi:23S rRNA (uracil1939-C5)-methyltransferase|nr:class I SAM-dependent RNA methyltransferase [Paracoccaceae bacterium]
MTRVEHLTHQGMGRTAEGKFVPRVLPGEEIELLDDGTARILTPSADRVAPPCRHYKSCGGCAMQHASDAFVAKWKIETVARALAAQGIEAEISGIETSPPASRRRAKLSGRRTKKGTLVGFHGRASDVVVEVPDCRLLSPALLAILPALHDLTALAASRKGEVGLTVTESLAGPDIQIETDKELTGELRIELAALAQKHRIARLVWQDEQVVMIEPPQQRFGKAQVVPPAGAFLQATAEGEAALLRAVKQAVGGASKVADLFSGCGTFALPLAETAEVHAVEGDKAMVAALDRGWRETQGLKRVTSEARDLFRRPLLRDELAKFDAIVIDPPRAGAEAQVAEIAASTVPLVAMVSCNPITFARDVKALIAAGFRIESLVVVDQFRWSSHIEVAAKLVR